MNRQHYRQPACRPAHRGPDAALGGDEDARWSTEDALGPRTAIPQMLLIGEKSLEYCSSPDLRLPLV
ncbi:hypothetical protein ACNPON_12150 [Glutamicibacter sp. AGC13]